MSDNASSRIETMRILATFLLVSYHGIGPGPDDALKIAYPHPLRFGNDLFIDIRMPVFAFIAGWVYALRPITRGSLGSFLSGKIRRLVIPGVIAALIFWVVGTTLLKGSVAEGAGILNVLTLSFVHYWFLQSILLLLVATAMAEALTGRPLPNWALLGLGALVLLSPRVYHLYIEIGGAQYLAPYFLFGLLVCRNGAFITRHRVPILVVAAIAVAIALYLNISEYQDTGELNRHRRDVHSLLMASGSIMLMYLLLPQIGILAAFGSASFTIYLYHVFGTSGARRATDMIGIDNTWVQFAFVVAAGFLLPVLLHAVLSRVALTRRIFLGLRR